MTSRSINYSCLVYTLNYSLSSIWAGSSTKSVSALSKSVLETLNRYPQHPSISHTSETTTTTTRVNFFSEYLSCRPPLRFCVNWISPPAANSHYKINS